ncbi:protein of unknown function [Cnuella takakiae]|uniref:NodB homology domain-containing protein n=1 Tax=Cnuella takakiae TaxID=1302690 RepID=A0A1M4Y4T7_9BACT|nr:polysaccharide deacetylase family protein [Cnuella takakiae]OLY93045.1 hypothetical protein BUE76_14925 [Cnuella takakiae]SHF00583.1 protein of unknown function [Cnuella takakiae]
MEKGRTVLLSFDLEEFDMPLEYGRQIPLSEQLAASDHGMDALLPILDKYAVPATFYTTANYAQHRRQEVKALAERHEIASHTFYHTEYCTAHLAQSRNLLQEISGQEIRGLRMPRMRPVDMADVAAAGYAYDSSINPTWLPGRYNNRHLPRTFYWEKGMLRLPASVSPGLRVPLFWLLFKNIPLQAYLALCRQTLKKDGYLNLYFHPWEFTQLKKYGMPGYTWRTDGKALTLRLGDLIGALQGEAIFEHTGSFLLPEKIAGI